METEENKEAKMWASLCHLTALSVFSAIPLINVLLPLIIWILKKDEFPLVDEQGKESLIFQISITIYLAIAFALSLVFIGLILLPVIYVFDAILVIIATIKLNQGETYKYPYALGFIRTLLDKTPTP
ncbi:MAG: DUF4870 domain-containing protein [Nitrospinota bacterium]|nr:DUF4870 domain-containing protein [Nitrospinota bacterium]